MKTYFRLAVIAGAFVVMSGAAPPVSQQPALPVEQRVESIVSRQMALRQIPGLSVGVVRDGQPVFAKGFGEANVEWKAPATPDTVYLLASMTKQFTATAITLLVKDGRVGLDDLLSRWVSGPSWSGITIRHLLTHTAGLRDRFELTPEGRMLLDYSTAQMLEAAARTPVDAPPGTKFQYSDQGYFLLGLVVERASGQSYGEFLRQRIFAPAGMTSTSLHDWKAIVPGRADGYSLEGDKLIGSRRRYQFGLVSHYGVQSNVRDLARYDAALSAGTILPAATLNEMWTPGRLASGKPGEVAGIAYGFGWFLERFRGHRAVHHGGSTGTCLYRLPDDRVSVILLTNLEQAAGSDPCEIARMIAAQYLPDIAIVQVPVITDSDAARTQRLRAAIEAFAKGTLDPANYTAEALPILTQAAKAQAAGFASLGALSSFELIADDTLASRVVWYRARYASMVVHFRFVLDQAGKIASLQAR